MHRRHRQIITRNYVWRSSAPFQGQRGTATAATQPITAAQLSIAGQETSHEPGMRRCFQRLCPRGGHERLRRAAGSRDARRQSVSHLNGTEHVGAGSMQDDQQSHPLFTFGGLDVRVWTPVDPPYNALANGDLAGQPYGGAG